METEENQIIDDEPMLCPVCGRELDYDYWGVWCDNCNYKERL